MSVSPGELEGGNSLVVRHYYLFLYVFCHAELSNM